MIIGFVTLCDLWVVVVLLSGLKAYRSVLVGFLIGYGTSVGGALCARSRGLAGLLTGFLVGQIVLLFLLFLAVIRRYPRGRHPGVVRLPRPARATSAWRFTGFFYNLGVWVDKFAFWANPLVSDPVIGPLRASIIYDIPIFLAYLSIVPGMAVFLVRVETDFAESYDAFYQRGPQRRFAGQHPAPQGDAVERRPPGHGRHLQGAGGDPAAAVPHRPPHPRRHGDLAALPAAVLRRPGGRRHPGADAGGVQRAVLSGPAGRGACG